MTPMELAATLQRSMNMGTSKHPVAWFPLLAVCTGALLGACSDNDSSPASTSTPTIPTGRTVETATPVVEATAKPTATHLPGQLTTKDGVPVFELTIAAKPAALPNGSVLYYSETCAVCIGGDLYRWRQDGDGAWQREKLFGDGDAPLPQGYPLGAYVTDGKGTFAVLWCESEFGACGKRHDGSVDDVLRAVLHSTDWGATWTVMGEVGPGTGLLGAVDGQLVVAGGAVGAPKLYPDGRVLTADELAHLSTSPLPAGIDFLVDSDGPGAIANDNSTLVATTRTGQKPESWFAFPGGTLRPSVVLSPTRLLGTAERSTKITVTGPPPRDVPGFDRLPVVIDLAARTIAPIEGLTPLNQYAWIAPLLLVQP